MATILVNILGNAKQFKSELDSAVLSTEKANSGFSKMSRAAGIAGVAIAGGLTYGLVKAAGAAGDFQQSLNVMQATTNATSAEMAQASKVAIQLGKDVKLPAVSAKDAADAMLELGRDGFTAMQSMKAARATLLLVTAAQTDVATSAKVITQNIHAFGLQAKDSSMIVDQMAGFMNATGTSFDAFADSLSYIAAPAHTVGQSFKDTAAEIAILSQKGIEGSMAGTGLRQVLVRLGADGSKAGALFKEMGVDVINANGQFIGIRKTIEQLAPKLAEMTSAQRLAFFKEAFGQTAMNQANILFTTTIANYDKATEAIGRKGQADQLAAAHMKGYNGALAQLSSALETLQIQIGTAVLPALTKFAIEMATVAGFFVEHKTLTQALIVAIGALAAVLITASIASKALAAAQIIGNVATAAATGAWWLLNAAVSANPFVLAGIALAALTIAIIEAYKHSATFRAIVTGAFDAVTTAAQTVLDFFRSNWPIIATLISGPFAPVVLLATNAFGIRSALTGAFNNIIDFFKALPDRILGALGDVSKLLYNAGASIIQGLIDGLQSKIKDVTDLAGGIAKKISDIKGPLEADRVLLVPHGQAIIQGLQEGLSSGLDSLNRMTSSIAPTISQNVAAAPIAAATAGGGGGNSITVNIDGWVGNDQDIAEKIRNIMIRTGRNTTGGTFGRYA